MPTLETIEAICDCDSFFLDCTPTFIPVEGIPFSLIGVLKYPYLSCRKPELMSVWRISNVCEHRLLTVSPLFSGTVPSSAV